jgi:hypothetical protein
MVESIVDIVDEEITATSRGTRDGVHQSAVVQGRVTEFLDVKTLIRLGTPEMADELATA